MMADSLELLLEYGGSRKQLTVTPSALCETVSKELSGLGVEGSPVVCFSGKEGDFLLQRWSERWSTFVDVSSMDDIVTGDRLSVVVKPVVALTKVQSSTKKASTICNQLGNPSASTASVLSKLFRKGPSDHGKKRSFDPKADCVVSAQKSKKKATNQRIKTKKLTIVLLKKKPSHVPKGYERKKLKSKGQIVKVELKRCMTSAEVRGILTKAFPEFEDLETAQYLRCGQDNIMLLNDEQVLDGEGVIDLAGQGSVYMTQQKVDRTEALIAKADNVLATIQAQSRCTDDVESDADQLPVDDASETMSQEKVKDMEGENVEEVMFDEISNVAEEVEVTATVSIEEWRTLRQAQDEACAESLRIDQLKEQEVIHLKQREDKAKNLKDKLKNKFDHQPGEAPILIGFKFSDGRRIEHNFVSYSTIKDLYQFVFLKSNSSVPFKLLTTQPQHTITLSSFTSSDQVSEHGSLLVGRTLIVQEVDSDANEFLELLIEETTGTENTEGAAGCDYNTFDLQSPKGPCIEESRRLDFMKSIGGVSGPKHTIKRNNICADVISLYNDDNFIKECPLFMGYEGESGIDDGGITRDMYAAFWEKAYNDWFDGATLLVPLIHPATDLSVFPTLGK